jgi:hypothetical protein
MYFSPSTKKNSMMLVRVSIKEQVLNIEQIALLSIKIMKSVSIFLGKSEWYNANKIKLDFSTNIDGLCDLIVEDVLETKSRWSNKSKHFKKICR